MVNIAVLLEYPVSRVRDACREVGAHYLRPATETIEYLYTELCSGQDTDLTRDFYKAYAEQPEGAH